MRRDAPWFLGSLGLTLLFFFEAMAQPFFAGGEPWMLQVAHRMHAGDVLYRDVFFGVTPLSIDVLFLMTGLFGTEVVVCRALWTLVFAGSTLLAAETARHLGVSRGSSALVALGVLSLSVRTPDALYTPLSMLFLLACFRAALSWDRLEADGGDGTCAALLRAGLFAGLAFGCKQNVGALAFVALSCAVAARPRDGIAGRLVLAAAAFLLPVALVLLPVWLTGGLPGLAEYGFLGKGTYLRVGAVGFGEALRPWFEFVTDPEWSWFRIKQLAAPVRVFVGPAALGALACGIVRTPPAERPRGVTVLVFCAAAQLSVFPRFDDGHLSYSLPVLLAGLAYAWDRLGLSATGYRLTALALAVYLAARLSLHVVPPLSGIVSGTWRPCRLPHFRGVLISAEQEQRLAEGFRTLADASDGGRLLILSESPSAAYLGSGLTNPSRFDYTLATTFGRTGQAEVLAALRAGAIRAVCLEPVTGPQRPALLEDYVTSEMERISGPWPCTLYRTKLRPLRS